ncbi:MAG: XrtA system polysaccharide chain length determinant [Steroidobacteraceae bacterium]
MNNKTRMLRRRAPRPDPVKSLMNTPPSIHAALEDVLDQLRGAWRFRKIALNVAWGTALVLWIVIFLVPNTYESYASVFVDTQTTLDEATRGLSLGNNIDSQIQRVREAILGGPELNEVASQTNLLAGALTPAQQQLVIEQLRKNIDIEGNLDADGTRALFTITYKDQDRARSLQVVERLLNTFVEGSLGGKQQGSEEAEDFLTNQIADYGRRLSASEQRLAAFKKTNIGLLPDQQGDYFARLQSENDALSKTKQNLDLAVHKRDALALELRTGQRFTAGSSPGAEPQDPALLDTEGEITRTRQRLNQLLLKFTDQYPDVIALRQTLKTLQAREKAQIAAAKDGDIGAATELHLAANPVYQRIQEKYDEQQVNIATLQESIIDQEKDIANLRALVSTAPEVQAQYAQLTRDYDVTKTQYNALLGRLDSARLGQQAASTGEVKFQIIDPPTSRFQPVSPPRPLLIIGALLFALAAGLGTGYALHMLQPVFVSARQLSAATGLTVLGAVSLACTEPIRAQQRRNRLLYIWGGAALFVAAIGLIAVQAHISNLMGELRA